MSRARHSRLMSEINVVPYIDVMLVLLIIFMITAPLLTQGIKVDLPNAAADPLDPALLRDNEPLVLSIDREGNLYLNIGDDQESPIDERTVLARTAAVLRRNAQSPEHRGHQITATTNGNNFIFGARLFHHLMKRQIFGARP